MTRGHPDERSHHPADRVNFCLFGESGEQHSKRTKPDMGAGFCILLAYIVYIPPRRAS